MGPIVAFLRCDTYQERELLSRLEEGMNLCGGWSSFVQRGTRVLLKPNILAPKPPEKAVITHPNLLIAVARQVREAGGIPFLGEIPGLMSLSRALKKLDLVDVLEGEGITVLKSYPTAMFRNEGGGPYREIELAKAPFEFDLVLNLPKVKTHAQMMLTLGVKNLFGFIPLKNRVKLHLQANIQGKIFAGLLLDLYRLIRPSLTILDGVVGMEGQGPASGEPRQLGFLGFATDALALDCIVSEQILGLHRREFPLTAAASERGIRGIWPEEVDVRGEAVEDLAVTAYRFPPRIVVPSALARPAFLVSFLRERLLPRPVVHRDRCKECMVCVEACPPKALKAKKEGLAVDYRQCIRCFCCHELCPEGAISVRKSLLLRVAEKLPYV